MFYILSLIATAIIPLVLAGYGGHLGTDALSNPKKRKQALLLVWSLAIGGIAVSGLQQLAQHRMDMAKDAAAAAKESELRSELAHISDQIGVVLTHTDSGVQQARLLSAQERVDVLSRSLGMPLRDPTDDLKRDLAKTRTSIEDVLVYISGRGEADPRINLANIKSGQFMSPDLIQSCISFLGSEEALVASSQSTAQQLRRATDEGQQLLGKLQTVPSNAHLVAHSDIVLYADPYASRPILNVSGVEIVTPVNVKGMKDSAQVFPTTKVRYYKQGMLVGWEWQSDPIIGPAWYRDPVSGQIRKAFDQSMQFVSKDLKEVLPKA